jgi:hypothetical protein
VAAARVRQRDHVPSPRRCRHRAPAAAVEREIGGVRPIAATSCKLYNLCCITRRR